MTPQTLLVQLGAVELELWTALAQDDDKMLQRSLSTFCSIEHQLITAECHQPVDTRIWIPVANAVRRIHAITASFCRQEENLSQRRKEVEHSVELLWRKEDPQTIGTMRSADDLDPGKRSDPSQAQSVAALTDHNGQSLNAVVMRRWMLDHIEHPFPDTKDKEEIAEETNEGLPTTMGHLRPEQATLWFINTRRRSGWTTWARRFANSDKNRLRAIVAAIRGEVLDASGVKEEEVKDSLEELIEAFDAKDGGLTKTELAELCKAEFLKVTDWIEQGSKERVGDWMDKVVSEAKASLKRKKQDRRAARKLLAERRRGRAAAATRDAKVEESEDELAEEQLPARERLGLRPIRRIPQQRNLSGASSSSSCLSSAVSTRLYPSGSSSSAATSFDSSYELGLSSRGCATDRKTESAGRYFQQLQVSDDQSSGEVCSPSPTRGLSRLPPFAPQQQQRAEQAHSTYEKQQASLAHLQPPASSSWSAPTGSEAVRYDEQSNDSHSFFMPSVTAAAALGNNWGMPVSTSAVDNSMTGQSDEAVSYGGWLAWSGQMMSGEA